MTILLDHFEIEGHGESERRYDWREKHGLRRATCKRNMRRHEIGWREGDRNVGTMRTLGGSVCFPAEVQGWGPQVELSARESEGPLDSSRQDYQSQHHLWPLTIKEQEHGPDIPGCTSKRNAVGPSPQAQHQLLLDGQWWVQMGVLKIGGSRAGKGPQIPPQLFGQLTDSPADFWVCAKK